MRAFIAGLLFLLVLSTGLRAQKPRERDLKLPIGGTAGPLDAITDVAGVEVGHTTLNTGSGKLVVGKGPVRTGVTVVHPRGKANPDPVFAAWFTLNGNGEMTGTTWVQESGLLEGPVAITNTHSVGVVRDAIIQWEVSQKNALQPWWLPVVAETYDGGLNDINGFHVKPEHVMAALDGASGGVPKEGAVGGGTGMVCHGFKGGIGTASRKLPQRLGGFTVGVLVQTNFGGVLSINGAPVGQELGRYYLKDELTQSSPDGSIIMVIATDAPLDARNLSRLAARAIMGLAKTGAAGSNGSGDYAIAFSTAADVRIKAVDQTERNVSRNLKTVANDATSPLFLAAIEATEEAIYNSLFRATTTTGRGHTVEALPLDRTVEILRKHGLIVPLR